MPEPSSPRPVRAPRGTQLSCRGWQQEAALRMLMNNLDPEVAEAPDELIVYGGAGKAARDWASFDAIVRHAAPPQRRRDPARAVRQAGGRLHDPRVGTARAHRQRQPRARLGELGRVPPPRRPRAHDVRADDRRLVDLHRHAGDPAGHLRDLRRRGAEAFRCRPQRAPCAHRRPRRDGRGAAAGRHHGRRGRALRRGRRGAYPPPARDGLPRRRPPSLSTRRCGWPTRPWPRSGLSPSACSATPPTSTPSSYAAVSSPISSPIRPRPTTP